MTDQKEWEDYLRHLNDESEAKVKAFKEKLKSINFGSVPGGARGK